MKKNPNYQKGFFVTMVLIFSFVFLILLGGLFIFILYQHRYSLQTVAREDAFHIAEAGLNYYRWYLNHYPNDVQAGQDWCCDSPPCEVCGPYEFNFYDTNNSLVGHFSLQIKPKKICDEVLGIQIIATAWTEQFPEIRRTLKVKYASTSVAEYAYLIDEAVWAGEDRAVYGKYHSNNGVRMDATHNSIVTSATEEWACTLSFGCSPFSCPSPCRVENWICYCPGVFGDGGPQDLWNYPIPPFDFNGITADLAKIKDLAQSKGKYFPPSTDLRADGKGYHLTLNPDGTFDLKIITSLGRVWAYDYDHGWHWDYHVIQSEADLPSPYGPQDNVALPSGCGLIFVEDDLWIEGTVSGRITVASANLVDPFTDTGIVLNGNIDYTTLDGSDSLAVITQEDILIPLYSPEDMVVAGVYVSQKGRSVSRNYYSCWRYPWDCKKDTLTIYGSVISRKRVGTKWVNFWGIFTSGYETRYDYFDQKLALDPPPLLPYVSEDMQFISWEEVE